MIGRGTKIDNLVQVGHNVRIGERCLVMAKAGIAGSARIGSDVIIGGAGWHTRPRRIGDGARVGAMSGVIGNLAAGATVSGYPARNHANSCARRRRCIALAPIAQELANLLAERDPNVPRARLSGQRS